MASKIKSSSSQHFLEEKKLTEFKMKAERERFRLRMEMETYKRESARLLHERELERGRIKSAEIRKTLERKRWEN